jgi:hypothetical protein
LIGQDLAAANHAKRYKPVFFNVFDFVTFHGTMEIDAMVDDTKIQRDTIRFSIRRDGRQHPVFCLVQNGHGFIRRDRTVFSAQLSHVIPPDSHVLVNTKAKPCWFSRIAHIQS